MKYAFASVAFGLGANALVAREASQCVQLKASGGQSGVLGQLDDGQNRVGGGHPTGCYCLSSDGGFTDSNGRGCILTPPTTQFQCDTGASPTSGFAIGSGGSVTYNGNSKFYACPATDSEYNVYTSPVEGQDKCVEISLSSAGSCGAGSGQPSAPAASQPAQSQSAPKPSQPAQSYPAQSPPAQSQPAPKPSQPAPKPSQPAPKPSQPAQSQPAPKPSQPAPKPSQPAQSYPAQSPPAQSQPAPKPSQPAPKPSQPAQSYPVQSPPAETQPAPKPSQPAQSQPAPKPSQPAQSYPAQSPPAQSQPAPKPSQHAPQPSQPAQSPPAPQPSAPAQSGNQCPTDLNGEYQYPHLIIPVDSQQPDNAAGTSYNGKVNSHTCSIFNFDIPSSYAGKICSVVFLFPEKKDLETSSFTVSGSGKVDFTQLQKPADQQTCYANQPGKKSDLQSMAIAPGNSYAIASGECAAGQTVSYEMCSEGDFALDYFQDYNPSPLGLYVRQC